MGVWVGVGVDVAVGMTSAGDAVKTVLKARSAPPVPLSPKLEELSHRSPIDKAPALVESLASGVPNEPVNPQGLT